MRRIQVAVPVPSKTKITTIYKTCQSLDATSIITATIPDIRDGNPIVDVETNYTNACEILAVLIEFIATIESLDEKYVIKLLEQKPGEFNVRERLISCSDLNNILAFEKTLQFRGITSNVSEYVEELSVADWTSNIGQPTVSSNELTINSCGKLAMENWLDVVWEARNQLSEKLITSYPYHYFRSFSSLVEALDFKDLVNTKTKGLHVLSVGETKRLQKGLELLVHLACLEKFYEELLPTSFGVQWASWLIAGRIPCGWEGTGDQAKLVII